MTLRHRFTLRSVSAGAVLGLAASTAAVLGTAGSASAATINFDCTILAPPAQTFAVDVTTNAPATVPAGTSISPTVTSVMTIPDGLADLLRVAFGPEEIAGTIQATNLVNGVAAPMTITIAKTAVPADGDIVLTGTGVMSPIAAGAMGTTHQISAGAQQVTMVPYVGGTAGNALPGVACTPSAGSNTLVSSFTTSAAPASTTTVKAKYAKKARKATVTATVSATGATPAGSVTFTLKKGKKVTTKTVAVAGGTAKAIFKKLKKKGTYTVTASYSGTVGASSATTKFKVR